jgi:hypothetical protein
MNLSISASSLQDWYRIGIANGSIYRFWLDSRQIEIAVFWDFLVTP